MTAMPRLTVIIPAYNAQSTIRRCLESVAGQTIKDIEIIVVDDGSEDLTVQIAKEFADERLLVLSQKHSGQGAARNYALTRARSRYVGFVDSDDCVDKEMFEKMLLCALANDADMVQCNINDVYSDLSSVIQLPLWDGIVTVSDTAEYFSQFLYKNVHSFEVCNKIFRRSFLEENNLRFEDNEIVYAEDLLFNMEAALCLHRAAFLKEAYYNYYQSPQSHSKIYTVQKAEKFCTLFKLFLSRHTDAPRAQVGALAILILLTNIARIDTQSVAPLCRREDIRGYMRLSGRANRRLLHRALMAALLTLPMPLKIMLIRKHYRVME